MLSIKYNSLSGSLQHIDTYNSDTNNIEKAVELRDLKIQELSNEVSRLKKILKKLHNQANTESIDSKQVNTKLMPGDTMIKSECAYIFSILLDYLENEGLGLNYNENGDLIDTITNRVIIPSNRLSFKGA